MPRPIFFAMTAGLFVVGGDAACCASARRNVGPWQRRLAGSGKIRAQVCPAIAVIAARVPKCPLSLYPTRTADAKMSNALPDHAKKNPTQHNIEAIAKLEQDALERRTAAERISEAIARFIGSVAFLLLQILLVLIWSAINLNVIPGVKPFDPFPFGILALVISSESVILTIFVLMSQNRMTRQAERRSHLDLQVGMLAEQELTTMLEMQQKICKHIGVDVASSTSELQGFAAATDVHKLASELDDKLPEK
jgi:uncharacterized membrane protein